MRGIPRIQRLRVVGLRYTQQVCTLRDAEAVERLIKITRLQRSTIKRCHSSASGVIDTVFRQNLTKRCIGVDHNCVSLHVVTNCDSKHNIFPFHSLKNYVQLEIVAAFAATDDDHPSTEMLAMMEAFSASISWRTSGSFSSSLFS